MISTAPFFLGLAHAKQAGPLLQIEKQGMESTSTFLLDSFPWLLAVGTGTGWGASLFHLRNGSRLPFCSNGTTLTGQRASQKLGNSNERDTGSQ